MSKHTPGPWVVGPVDDTVVTHLGADGVRREVAQIDGDYNEPDLWPVMEANARLIAAAPDLLSALHLVCEMIERPPERNCSCHISPPCGDCVAYEGAREAFDAVDRAISKATGEGR